MPIDFLAFDSLSDYLGLCRVQLWSLRCDDDGVLLLMRRSAKPATLKLGRVLVHVARIARSSSALTARLLQISVPEISTSQNLRLCKSRYQPLLVR